MDTLKAIGFVNTAEFQPAANHFKKYGRYDDGEPDTYYFDDYWNQEIDRCLEGYETGGVWIPGDYYFYLNYCRIQIVEEKSKSKTTYGEVHDMRPTKARRVGQRKEEFPAFWDVDYMYFRAVDIATNGIDPDEYIKLPINLNIRPDFLGGGHHFIWLKPRGVGASWKGAAKPLRNFSLIEDSKSYMMANEKEYLTKDGIWSKFHELNNWLLARNPVTRRANAEGIGKLSEWKKDMSEMHIRASFKFNDQEEGLMSEVFGVSLQNNWQKARGKRGQLILWEELGKFPNADKAWEVARESVESTDMNFGTMIGFGTGGTEGANFEALKTLFYNPVENNILAFDNIYDEGFEDSACAFFSPATMKPSMIDKDGNSLKETARAYYEAEREKAKKSKKPDLLPRRIAENPFTPREAVLEIGDNIFISGALVKHRDQVSKNKLYESMGTKGFFERGPNKDKISVPKFTVDPDLIPINMWPHKNKYDDLKGAAIIYQNPFKLGGEIPKDLYKLCLDPYRHDQTTGDSVGAAYVIEQANNITPTRGDIIVASYVGRPATQEDFNRQVFLLAEFYNAEIAFENDEPGDVVGYAKRNKMLKYLAAEFELAYDETLRTSEGSKRSFGMHMGSGKNNKRKFQGDIFLKQWLYSVRRVNEDGTELLNLHTIYDLGLLEELCGYHNEKNCDRISALRVGVYHMQEMLYNEVVPMVRKQITSKGEFFKKSLFGG